jgi:hypothetical protein
MYWRRMLVDSAGMVGLARVTNANIEEWLWRFAYLRKTLGRDVGCLVFTKKGELVYHNVTPTVLRRWVGLWTNWSDISRHAFVRQRQERVEQECDREVRDVMQMSDTCDEAKKLNAKSKPKKRRVKA